jgi:hypothetical protein
MTDHLLNNSVLQREIFFDILDDVLERSGSIDADVHIPLNKKTRCNPAGGEIQFVQKPPPC